MPRPALPMNLHELILDGWAAGKEAKQIAAEIGNVTVGQVSGVLHRARKRGEPRAASRPKPGVPVLVRKTARTRYRDEFGIEAVTRYVPASCTTKDISDSILRPVSVARVSILERPLP